MKNQCNSEIRSIFWGGWGSMPYDSTATNWYWLHAMPYFLPDVLLVGYTIDDSGLEMAFLLLFKLLSPTLPFPQQMMGGEGHSIHGLLVCHLLTRLLQVEWKNDNSVTFSVISEDMFPIMAQKCICNDKCFSVKFRWSFLQHIVRYPPPIHCVTMHSSAAGHLVYLLLYSCLSISVICWASHDCLVILPIVIHAIKAPWHTSIHP